MRKCLILLFLWTATLLAIPVNAQVTPQVRYMNVEKIATEPFLVEMPTPHWINASHFVFTFALFEIYQWGDQCYYTAWLDGDVFANWSIGFSEVAPFGPTSTHADQTSGLLMLHIQAVDFPYDSQVIDHPEDGLQTYYFYRVHFWFDWFVFKKMEVRVAGDYLVAPTYEESELVIIKNSKIVGDVENFRLKTVKQKYK